MRRGTAVGVAATMAGIGGFVAAAAEAQTVVPVKVSDSGQSVAMIAIVTINGAKVPLTVDTGATTTTIDARVAKKLKLPAAGKVATTRSIGCTSKSQPVAVSDWKLGDATLAPGKIVASRGVGLTGTVGLLGNDVLQQFGRVSFDFADRRLVLGDTVAGQPFQFPSTALVQKADPSKVVWPVVQVKLKGRDATLIADTGASVTTLDAKVAKKLKLKRAGKRSKIGAVTCKTTVQPVRLPRWSAGATPLPPGLAVVKRGGGLGVTDGLLGAPAISSFGQMTVAYQGKDTAITLGFPAPAPAPVVEPAPTAVPTAAPTAVPTATATPSDPPADPKIPPQPTG